MNLFCFYLDIMYRNIGLAKDYHKRNSLNSQVFTEHISV